MRVGSLFAGIGGFDLGLERAGMRTIWQVEINPYRRAVLAGHFPDAERFGDIRDCGAHNLAPVNLICGGFPCQPVSRVGRRQGTADERWVWPEFARVVGELRPRYVLVENVPGLLAHGMGDVLGDLAALGYDAEWDCLSAAAFGAPHIRDRVWLVATDSSGAGLEGNGIAGAIGDGRREGHLADPSQGRHRPSHETVFAGRPSPQLHGAWTPEPNVGRVANGVPARVDRLAALGDALVPQIAEWIGKRLMEHG